MVVVVRSGGWAERHGLRVGDVIQRANGACFLGILRERAGKAGGVPELHDKEHRPCRLEVKRPNHIFLDTHAINAVRVAKFGEVALGFDRHMHLSVPVGGKGAHMQTGGDGRMFHHDGGIEVWKNWRESVGSWRACAVFCGVWRSPSSKQMCQ
jgi:hypothetical protein